MKEIQVLDEATIDKIAAGEVVDRPASVVKELVENAVDSGADAVTVEAKDGGISMIRVTDNGSGMEKEQAPKAFLRHATSKIRCVGDLQQLSSLGFRGEALSSICAVAQVELLTRTGRDMTGLRYCIEGGVEKEKEEIGAPEGTTIFVRNLFYNVPARKKFLKTPQTEGSYISDLMEHLALSHPEIAFKYVLNGQVKFHTSGNGNVKEILYRIYGRELALQMQPISREEEGMRLSGFLGSPAVGRASRSFEAYFINGRYIKDPILSKAAEDAYKGYLMQHKYPFFALHFTLPPDRMDVNVHPSKMEVRFHEPMRVADFIYRSVKETLSGREMIKEISLEQPKERREEEKKERVKREQAFVPEPFETELRRRLEISAPPMVAEESAYQAVPSPTMQPVQMELFSDKIMEPDRRGGFCLLGQAFGTYWIVEFGEKLLFIDQHAAHEKVKYERLCRQLREGGMVSQNLNPPVILSLSGREEELLKEYEKAFRELGFEIEPFGGNEYALRSVPADLFGFRERELLLEVLDELDQGSVLRGGPEAVSGKLASMACKAAVKGNRRMSRQEAEALIDELLTLDNPYHCPHGRPTVITMSKYEMEKRFSRIV